MFDQEARLARILARHRDAMVVSPLPGRTSMIRRDEILVADRDVAAVEDMVRRWYDSRENHSGVARLRLRAPARVDVCELAARLSGEGRHRRLAVSPNHVLHGQPLWWSGSADLPRPVPTLPPPAAAPDTRRQVRVAVLDTGLSPHPWWESADWYADQREDAAELLDADLDYELDAQAGHGTFVTGIILQHAPAATIHASRVLGSDGVGDELDLVRALHALAHRGDLDLVNLSAGCHTYDDRPSPVVARAVSALGRSTVIVACAGNSGSDRPFWPAALKTVIAVAALDVPGEERAWFSNYGWWVDAATPGVGVTSAFVTFNGSRPRLGSIDPDDFRGYASWSGTSFTAPAVTGAIAARMATDDLPATEAADRILDPSVARTLPDLGVLPRLPLSE
jgi:subtilisin family serine protease